MTRVRSVWLLLLTLAALVGSGAGAAPQPLAAEGASLNGLMAPEMNFPAGLNGIEGGTTLSSFRGRPVWIKFWLRDCPHCRKTLPLAQELHELYGASGLVVLTVVHQYGPEQVRPFLQQQGYTFPVACDPTGALAELYQVKRRPTDYLVGIDGRVKHSNDAPLDLLLGELAKQRLAELGRVPTSLEGVKQRVAAWDYGAALREAQTAAAAADASAEVRDFSDRLDAIAKRRLPIDIERARVLWRRKRLEEAGQLLQQLAAGFASSKYADIATAALKEFEDARAG
jgi:thiol-disulfide isomerase/thioredoxin